MLRNVWVREVKANRFSCFHVKFIFGEEQSLGDAGNINRLKAFLCVKRSFVSVFCFRFQPV